MSSRVDEVKLKPWEEIVGVCTKISVETKTITLHLLVQNRQCRVVFDLESKEGKIVHRVKKDIVSRRIGILKTDDPGKPIAIRIINSEGSGGIHNGFD